MINNNVTPASAGTATRYAVRSTPECQPPKAISASIGRATVEP